MIDGTNALLMDRSTKTCLIFFITKVILFEISVLIENVRLGYVRFRIFPQGKSSLQDLETNVILIYTKNT